MGWLILFGWAVAALGFVRWFAQWRYAGRISFRMFLRESRRALGNMQGLILLAGLFMLIALPFDLMFDLVPLQFIPLMLPLAMVGVLGSTGPVSFLVLGPSRAETTETCTALATRFPLLRSGAAVEPMKLGAVLSENLGPSGNLWMGAGGGSWQSKITQMIKDAPLVIFDGRVVTPHTRWEFFHLLESGQLAKVIVVGPVRERTLALFTQEFGVLPVVELKLLPTVVKAASTRTKLLAWYERRRLSIERALIRMSERHSASSQPYEVAFDPVSISLSSFYQHLPHLISMYTDPQTQPREN